MVRQLTAIMFTDMVGYTALMQRDERLANALRERQLTVLRESVSRHGGQVLQLYGDGSLSVFRSAVQAVECAVAIQLALREDPAIPLRVGVHSGDIVHDDGGVFGDGVNVAARIQGLAAAGSVLLSAKVHDEVKNHPDIRTTCLGEFSLKNVRRTWEIHAVVGHGLTVPDDGSLARSRAVATRSVAVLPFDDLGPDTDKEHFGDGMAEEIIHALTRVNGLKVIARASSFSFKTTNLDVRTIAERLGVTHLVTGSIRRHGRRVRVNAQLIDAETAEHVFAERYDRNLEDILQVQDQIAKHIVERLAAHLGPVQTGDARTGSALVRAHSHDTESYEEYLRGRFEHARWTPPAVRQALAHFERAAALDEDCALPYLGVASGHVFLARSGHLPADHAYPRALAAARHALDLDEGAGEAHRVEALVQLYYAWDWDGAYRSFQKALSLTPGSAEVHHAYGLYLRAAGEHDEAVEEMREAVALDPLAVHHQHALGVALKVGGRMDEAESHLRRALAMDPAFRPATEALGWIRYHQGRLEESAALFERIPEQAGLPYAGGANRGYAYAALGRWDDARRMERLLQDRARAHPEVNLSVDFALLASGMGDLDAAFSHLNRAADSRVGAMVFLRSNPIWNERLREDPRFSVLADRIGCPEKASPFATL